MTENWLQVRDLHTAANPGEAWQFSLPDKGCIGLSGPSGAGKTSLLGALAGTGSASGHIAWGKNIWLDGRLRTAPHRRDACQGFQDTRLFSGASVADNLALAHRYSRRSLPEEERRSLVRAFGIESLLSRPVEQLSGGEAQRVALLRQLFSNARLQLCDEALSAVDRPQRLRGLLPLLADFWRRHPALVIWTSHCVEEIQLLAAQCLWLEDGALQGLLSVEEVAARLEGEQMPAFSRLRAEVVSQEGGLLALDCGGERLYADRLTGSFQSGQEVHFLLAAADVSLALQPPGPSSILNCVPVTVTAVARLDNGRKRLGLSAGEVHFAADISALSSERLSLEVGTRCFAQFKAGAPLGL